MNLGRLISKLDLKQFSEAEIKALKALKPILNDKQRMKLIGVVADNLKGALNEEAAVNSFDVGDVFLVLAGLRHYVRAVMNDKDGGLGISEAFFTAFDKLDIAIQAERNIPEAEA